MAALPSPAVAAERVPTIQLGGARAAATLGDFSQQPVSLTPVNNAFNSKPVVSVASSGTATVVWRRGSIPAGTNSIQAARINANGYVTNLVDLYATANTISVPVATTTPSGLTTIAWTEAIGSDVVARAMTVTAGNRKGAPLTLSAAGLDVERVRLATADSGASTVAWRAATNNPEVTTAQTVRIGPNARRGGALAKLTRVLNLGTASFYSYGPVVATTPKGVATLVWNEGVSSSTMIKAMRQDAGHRFGRKINVASARPLQYFMEVASAPSGQTALLWSVGGTAMHGWLDRSGRVGAIREFGGTGSTSEATLAIAPSGASTVLWTTRNDPQSAPSIIQIAPNSAMGRTFGFAGSAVADLRPASATSPSGVTTFVWSQGTSSKRAIVARRLDQRNRLTSQLILNQGDTTTDQVNPAVATASNGVSTVAYERDIFGVASAIEVVRID